AFILIIAAIASYGVLEWRLSQSAGLGTFINQSGRQRMLSQRISMLVLAISKAEQPNERAVTQQQLAQSIRLMRTSHATLAEDSRDSPLRRTLFFEPGDLDIRVEEHLDRAEQFIEVENSDEELQKNAAAFFDLKRINSLLSGLDSVVVAYELEDRRNYQNLRSTERATLFVILSTVALIFWFIARPLANLVTHTLESLETANHELMEFSYRISHDLKSPIVSALSVVGIARSQLESSDVEQAKVSTGLVQKSLEKVATTIADIVALLRSKRAEAPVEEVHLSELIDSAVDAVRHLDGFEMIEWDFDINANVSFATRPIYVRQTLENLLSNAIKYRNPETQPSTVGVEANIESDTLNLNVIDNGLGIAPEFHDQMFKMFQRFHPNVDEGTGLGLYLIAQNVRAVEGKIEYSLEQPGSRFSVEIPVSSVMSISNHEENSDR
ncbi:MAG: ATP-binding protein, partial [Planctomycetota bacterium]